MGPASMLLAVHCKKSDPVDLRTPISQYIAITYSEQQAREAADDLASVNQLRNDVINLTGSLPQQRDTMSKYFRSLSVMETRFPISREREHVMLSFTWYDAFRNTKRTEQFSIHFEKAAVVFNIGAVLTQIGLGFDKSTDQGLKDAARKFQEAAGAFAFLRDVAGLRVEQPRPVDISPEAAGMLEKLCLAQAQECVFEKARTDKKSAAILARLAKQVSVLYEDVLRLLSCDPLRSHFDRSWTAHVQVKATLYDVESQLQMGVQLHKDDEIGAEIARLKEAHRMLLIVKKEAKMCGHELQESMRFTEETLSSNLNRAERENATVYLMRIPNVVDLPAIQPYVLVKSLPPTDLDGSTEGMFQQVIPDSSAKALSKYSEMVDGIIRQQKDRLEAASDEARAKLREWDMPDALHALESGSASSLPDALRAELESLEDHGGVRHLHDLAGQIKDLRRVAAEDLQKVTDQLDGEAREDAQLREQYGSKWNRPASQALNSTMREKIAGYNANLDAAGQSDARLAQRLDENNSAFAGLSIDAAVSQMPRLQAPMVSTTDQEPAMIVTTLRRAMEQLDRLSGERAGLEEALKEEHNKDNILPKLMASTGNYDAMFTAELAKYQPYVAQIDSNLAKSAELLDVINKNTQAYRQAFGFREWRQACEGAAGGMRGKVVLFKEMRDNFSEGLRFYMSLQEAIQALGQQAGDYCLTRKLQRDDLIEDIRQNSDEVRQQREASEQARRMAQMTLAGHQQQGQHPGGPPQAQNYPPPAGYQAAQPPPTGPPAAWMAPARGYGGPSPQQYPASQQAAHQYPPPTPQYYQQPGQPQNPYAQQHNPYGQQSPYGQQQPGYAQGPPGHQQNSLPGYSPAPGGSFTNPAAGQQGGQSQPPPPSSSNPLWGRR